MILSQRPLLTACLAGVLAAGATLVSAQPVGDEPVRGPFLSATVRAPQSKTDAIAMKGIVVTVGPEKRAYVCYDADLLRVSMAWTGEFLEFGDTLNKIAWPPPPQVKGAPAFGLRTGPGWARDGALTDPRPGRQGPLPKDWAHYRGLYQSGDRVVLEYSVGPHIVLETPGLETLNGEPVFTRTLQFAQPARDQVLVLADGWEKASLAATVSSDTAVGLVTREDGVTLAVKAFGLPAGTKLEMIDGGRIALKLGSIAAHKPFRVALARNTTGGLDKLPGGPLPDLRDGTQGGPARWTETVVTKGVRGTGQEPYVVDTLIEPVTNPYNARTFFGGFDFFPDGRAAICTFHGDVWIVSGIDDNLERLTWKRHATGLFQPLGLKIVDGVIHVLGRDQITRLHDLNGDGEADRFENFNNDTVVTANYHEFSLDLHTDTEGNFYFAKGAPWEPEVTSPHQGCLIKVSRDGSRLEVVATGLRAPNGMAVGPRNEITVSDNQGHWMPSSKMNWVVPGGFYGMTPAAQKVLTLQRGGTNFQANPSDPMQRAAYGFKAWGNTNSPLPTTYDRPMCWLPMNMDNSSGGQVWVTGDKWGPFRDQLLFMSYGKCTLFAVLPETVDGVHQGAMVQFPLKFNSGVMRGRVNPRDGQVYLCGLKGWQNSATRDGGFYRVRHTGQPVRMPAQFRSTPTGVQISFTCPLEAKAAADPENYAVERWNYLWSGAYGSPEYSVSRPEQRGHDKPAVKSARLLPDGRTVALEIEDMRPADQLKVSYTLTAADGAAVEQDLYATIYKTGSAGP